MTFSILSPRDLSATTTTLNFAYPFFIIGTTQLHLVNTAEQSAAQ